jgi:hypothetical protein
MLLALMRLGPRHATEAKHRGSDGPRERGNEAGRQTRTYSHVKRRAPGGSRWRQPGCSRRSGGVARSGHLAQPGPRLEPIPGGTNLRAEPVQRGLLIAWDGNAGADTDPVILDHAVVDQGACAGIRQAVDRPAGSIVWTVKYARSAGLSRPAMGGPAEQGQDALRYWGGHCLIFPIGNVEGQDGGFRSGHACGTGRSYRSYRSLEKDSAIRPRRRPEGLSYWAIDMDRIGMVLAHQALVPFAIFVLSYRSYRIVSDTIVPCVTQKPRISSYRVDSRNSPPKNGTQKPISRLSYASGS